MDVPKHLQLFKEIINFFFYVHKWHNGVRLNKSFWEFQFWSEKCTKVTEKNCNVLVSTGLVILVSIYQSAGFSRPCASISMYLYLFTGLILIFAEISRLCSCTSIYGFSTVLYWFGTGLYCFLQNLLLYQYLLVCTCLVLVSTAFFSPCSCTSIYWYVLV